MHKFIIAAAAAATLATPALAQETAAPFSGPRVGVFVGAGGDDITDFDGTTIGVEAGYDWDVGEGGVVGLGLEYQTDLGDLAFDINEAAVLARVGAKVGSSGLVYFNGGYTRISAGATPFDKPGEDGWRLGLGGEFALGAGPSLKLEQRYLHYGDGVHAHQTVAGVNFRF